MQADRQTERWREQLQCAISKLWFHIAIFNIRLHCLVSEDWLRINESIILQLDIGNTSITYHTTHSLFIEEKQTSTILWNETQWCRRNKLVSYKCSFLWTYGWLWPVMWCDERTVLVPYYGIRTHHLYLPVRQFHLGYNPASPILPCVILMLLIILQLGPKPTCPVLSYLPVRQWQGGSMSLNDLHLPVPSRKDKHCIVPQVKDLLLFFHYIIYTNINRVSEWGVGGRILILTKTKQIGRPGRTYRECPHSTSSSKRKWNEINRKEMDFLSWHSNCRPLL